MMYEITRSKFNDFSTVSDSVFEEGLEIGTLGALLYLISRDPATYDITAANIATDMCCCVNSARKALYRLESTGHLERFDPRTEKGYKLKSQYTLYEESTGIDYYLRRTGKLYRDAKMDRMRAYQAQLKQQDSVKS